MRKKQILSLLAIIIAGTTLFMIHEIAKKARSKPNATLTSLHALSLDSTAVEISFIRADTSLVIIFSSECDICRIQLEELLENYHNFERYNILLLSHQGLNELLRIQAKYNLNRFSNFQILKMDELLTEEPFFSASNPSLFVLDHNGRLILQRKGYTSPELLINQLQKHQ